MLNRYENVKMNESCTMKLGGLFSFFCKLMTTHSYCKVAKSIDITLRININCFERPLLTERHRFII